MKTEMPGTVGVIGGGRMGAGIAQVFTAAGAEVAVVETGDGAAARARIADGLAKAAGPQDRRPDQPARCPVPASKLVEVVTTPETAPEVVEQVRGWVRAAKPARASTAGPDPRPS
ncbi:3-hydroxyacyl-CoA dehydrogenase NAD-binding domain-containing protein [Amycolatopsis sp. cmx-8-4]|uniref:3-hydroxyacyl-CoA dehydrogenase NAD-binding domain-containing protein n=1 Tax=Amycolatopsis sp. cmx-8-4 TaxID=2790947 RepID=UPI003978F7AC